MTDPVLGFLMMLGLMQEGLAVGSPPPGPPGAGPGTPPSSGPTPTPGVSPDPGAPVSPAPSSAPTVPPGSSVLPSMPPWPSCPVSANLPPFPGPGWTPDVPVTQAVSARAAYWNNLLWDLKNRTIVKPFVQELFGGQCVTFAAAWHPGDQGPQTFMATEAWKLASAPPVAPSTGTLTPVQTAAHAMNLALAAHGYKQGDQPVYRAFQQAAGLKADGFPGKGTMAALSAVLQQMGTSMAPVKVYPWLSKPGTSGYDGTNAPTLAEWTGGAPAVAPAVHVPPSHAAAVAAATPAPGQPPGPIGPEPKAGAWQTDVGYVARYQAALTYLAQQHQQPTWDPQGLDGSFGPHTQAAVKAFQAANGITPVDGECGPATQSVIDAAVAATAGAHTAAA